MEPMANLHRSQHGLLRRKGRPNTYLVDGGFALIELGLGAIRHGPLLDYAAILIESIGKLSDVRWVIAMS